MIERGRDVDFWEHLEALFAQAMERDDAERQAFVDEMCGHDVELRRELESMLAAADESDEFLESPAIAASPSDGSEQLPQSIGGYRIKRVIASGGMGTVYEAVQRNPHRTVALKVIRAGLVSREARRRFDYESQLLARLRHPGIAQVYEAGVHVDAGQRQPFFAMEFVPEARPITQYAADKQLSFRERLELFARVCDAIEHGHQQGVIHRDLKPSNILVGEDGEPRVIDFGVARSTDVDVARTTMQTEAGELLGTLQYMSPEQCTGQVDRIDTRSDVYSLGVVLFELLGGQLPYDVSGMSIYKGTRVIIENKPCHLSAIKKHLRGDVETIVAKTLEKECGRRYGSAGELAADIRRFLDGDAIVARPASTLYQLRVFARRNKTLVGGVAATIMALVMGLLVADFQRRAATLASEESQRILTFLTGTLAAANVQQNRGPDATLREFLDDAAETLQTDRSLDDQPLIRATLHATIGKSYRSLQAYHPQAEEHLRAALKIRQQELGKEHPLVAEVMHDLGKAIRYEGDGESERLLRAALDIRRRRLGSDDPLTLESMLLLSQHLAEDIAGDVAEMDDFSQRVLDGYRRLYGENSLEVAQALMHRALVLAYLEAQLDSLRMYEQALAQYRRLLPGDHSQLAMVLYDYASAVASLDRGIVGDLDEAERAIRQAREIFRKKFPPDTVMHGHASRELGRILLGQGRIEEAEITFREALKQFPNDRRPVWTQYWLGMALIQLGRFREAESELLAAQDFFTTSKSPRVRARFTATLETLYNSWGKPEQEARWRRKTSDEERLEQ